MKLSPPLIRQIVTALEEFMGDERSRRATLFLAFGVAHPVESALDLKEPTNVFVPLLVDHLIRFGADESGNHPLCILLDAISRDTRIGAEKRNQIQHLVRQLPPIFAERQTDMLPPIPPQPMPVSNAKIQTGRLAPPYLTEWLNDMAEAEEREAWSAMIHIGEHILSVDPDHNHARRKSAEAYNQRGMTFGHQRDYDRAIDNFTHALELDYGDGVYLRNRGICYHAKGDYDRAIEDFNAAIRIQPRAPDYYVRRAICYDQKNEFDAAIQDKTYAIQLDPNNAEYYRERSVSYRRRSEARRSVGDFMRAWDDLTRALGEANRAIQLNPNLGSAYFVRSRVYQALGDREAEAVDLETAAQLGDASAKMMLGRK